MAGLDKNLCLPVQSPPGLEFSSKDLAWSTVEGWHGGIDRVCFIPFAGLDDFVRGESANEDCPTTFHIEARRKQPCRPKCDGSGILEYALRPRRRYCPSWTERGCHCHFIVKRLAAEPSVALIIYKQDKHVDKNGLPCHGLHLDQKAAGAGTLASNLAVIGNVIVMNTTMPGSSGNIWGLQTFILKGSK
ncbi:OLC1v1012352C1 [Oldenlandia corymbosa var. corymbosa]|uniref:OLC1v1012352C1 n=1 Tax=Oldenlandia corymbosa var. corymbosa TaxID=529605 RepID=A0AAV1DVR8_OLDCO|nr:OLC1v1012352C1 [Oldenlandia corymbosa var. corymbosa]